MKFREKYPLEPIRYLGWKQPFASLMLHGKIETRVWDAKYRGWGLITASKGGYNHSQLYTISGQHQMMRMNKFISSNHLPYGQAIAIGYLYDSKRMADEPGDAWSVGKIEDKCFVKYNGHLWMHKYRDVQQIEPFDFNGAQGWRKLTEDIIDKIILINP